MNLWLGALGVAWLGGAMLAPISFAAPTQAQACGWTKPSPGSSTNSAAKVASSSSDSPLGAGGVLTLTGNGNYLELPAELFSGLSEATLECWVKWHTFAGNQQVFELDGTVPGLILLDLMMPEMDGFEFMQELRKKPSCRLVPVVVITAKDITDDDRKRLNGEVARLLQKSALPMEDFMAEVRSVTGLTGGGAKVLSAEK